MFWKLVEVGKNISHSTFIDLLVYLVGKGQLYLWISHIERTRSFFTDQRDCWNCWCTMPSNSYLQKEKKTPDFTLQSIWWFDGVAHENHTLRGTGVIIKTLMNIIYRWTFNCGIGSNTREKFLGVWATLSLAHRLGIDHL